MDESVYRRYIDLDSRHFWRRGKRRLVLGWLGKALAGNESRMLLDIGSACSLLPVALREYGNVVAVDPHEPAVQTAREKLGVDARVGRLPDRIPVAEKFDAITLIDVVEHIENDREALERVRDLLKDDGVLIVTVPAYQWLFGEHDRILHHKRRYSRKALLRVLEQAGFQVERASYYTCFLFPIALVTRLWGVLKPAVKTAYSNKPPVAPVNALCTLAMKVEGRVLEHVNLPFGLSLIAVARVGAGEKRDG